MLTARSSTSSPTRTPRPAIEFGASLAVVGNELVVGAPGSSLSGPGDGVAYVFDANADSTTFGNLLATLTIPDPDAQTDAQFGAAVGTTNTNIVVGARARMAAGRGLRVRGRHDPAEFRRPAARRSPTPTHRPALGFGAAVAGIGNNLIVGAPLDNTAGPRRRDRLSVRRHDRRRDRRRSPTRTGDIDRLRLGGRVGRARTS